MKVGSTEEQIIINYLFETTNPIMTIVHSVIAPMNSHAYEKIKKILMSK